MDLKNGFTYNKQSGQLEVTQTIKIVEKSTGDPLITLVGVALLLIEGYEQKSIKHLAEDIARTVIYPYAGEYIHTISGKAGLSPISLPIENITEE